METFYSYFAQVFFNEKKNLIYVLLPFKYVV